MKPKSTFILLLIILLVDNFCYGLMVPLVAEKLHLNTGQNAILSSSLIILLSPTYLVSIPIICSLSNFWGRKKALLICLALSAVGYMFFVGSIFLSSAFLILLTMNISDVATAEFPIAQAIIADTENAFQRSYFFGLLMFVNLIEIVSTQLHGALLHYSINYEVFSPMWVGIIILCVSVLNLFIAARYLSIPKAASSDKAFNLLENIVESLSNILSNAEIRRLLVLFALFSLAWGLYFQHIYYYLVGHINITSPKAALYVLYLCGVMLLALLIIYPVLIRYMALKKLLLLSLVVSGAGLSLISFLSNKNEALTVVGFIAIATVIAMPVMWVLLCNRIQPKYRAMLLGITYLIWTLLWEISGALVKMLNEYSVTLSLHVAMVLILGGLYMLCFYKKLFRALD